MAKLTINLLQPELLPKQPLLSLLRVLVLWFLLLFLMIAWATYNQISTNKLAVKFQQLSAQQQQQEQTLNALQERIDNNHAAPNLVERLDTLKVILLNKKALLSQLTDQSQTFAAGYSSSMTELATLHHKNLSLKQITINQGQLTFSGVAKTPDTVPQWLASFESSTFLSGKHFSQFSLAENDQGLTEFSVSSESLSSNLPSNLSSNSGAE